MSHVDKLYYCSCMCSCTTIIGSDFHDKCTFCRLLHKDKFPEKHERKVVTLG